MPAEGLPEEGIEMTFEEETLRDINDRLEKVDSNLDEANRALVLIHNLLSAGVNTLQLLTGLIFVLGFIYWFRH